MKTILWLLWFILCAGFAFAQIHGGSSSPDPYVLTSGNGEINIAGQGYGFSNINGKTLVSSVVGNQSTSAVIITTGQSNIQNQALGTYSVSNPTKALNFNIYDGGLYQCANPVLGTPSVVNSPNCQIADSLITAGTYNNVVVMPVAIGGTLCSDWNTGGVLAQRIVVAVSRLKSRGLTPATGWGGDFWILLHQGESDNTAGTARATLAACWRSVAAEWTSAGTGSARFFIATESIVANTASATVTGSQADAVASGCTTCRAGANWDSLTGSTNRQSDGTHLTQTGAASAAALDVTVITNCKNTSC